MTVNCTSGRPFYRKIDPNLHLTANMKRGLKVPCLMSHGTLSRLLILYPGRMLDGNYGSTRTTKANHESCLK